jgi:hypothetical protein
MHFHLPKPMHGWREFVGEVGIIVLGVLIALGAEQALEGLHDRHVAAQSRRDVREEVATDVGFYRGRLDESSCVAARLADLSKIIRNGIVLKDTVKWVGRPSDFAPFTERWRAVTSSARTALFPPDEQGRLDAIYGIFGRMDQESQVEQDAWTTLDVMQHLDGPIDPATRLVLLRAIEQARRTDFTIQLAGYYALFHAGKLGIVSNPETSPRPGDVNPVCMPLSTSPEQAEKLLRPRLPH